MSTTSPPPTKIAKAIASLPSTAAALAAIAVLGFATLACERGERGESTTTPADTGGSVAFQRVMRELQPGGLSLQFNDLQQAGLRGLAAMIDDILASLPAEELELPPGFSLRALLDETGLGGVHATGSSMAGHDGGRSEWRTFAWTPEGRNGLLTIAGGNASAFRALDHAPADTDLLVEMDLDLRETAERAIRLVEQFGGPEAKAELDQELKEPVLPDGSSLADMLPELKLRSWLVGRIDPERVMVLEDGFPVPAVDAVLVLEGAEWWWKVMADEIDAMVAEEALPFTRSEAADGAVEYRAVEGMFPEPMDLQPVLRVEQDGQRVWLATSPAFLAEVFEAPDGLRSQPGYAAAVAGMPTEGNLHGFASPRFITHFAGQFKDMLTESVSPRERETMLKVWSAVIKPAADEGGVAFMLSNSEDGMLLVSSAPFSSAIGSMGSVTNVAILASFAVPVFNRVSARAQQSKAVNEARQVALALRLYAQAHNGLFPENLERLEETGELAPGSGMIDGVMVGDRLVPWLYRPGLHDASRGNTPILMLAEPIGGAWIIAYVDASTHVLPHADPAELGFEVPSRGPDRLPDRLLDNPGL